MTPRKTLAGAGLSIILWVVTSACGSSGGSADAGSGGPAGTDQPSAPRGPGEDPPEYTEVEQIAVTQKGDIPRLVDGSGVCLPVGVLGNEIGTLHVAGYPYLPESQPGRTGYDLVACTGQESFQGTASLDLAFLGDWPTDHPGPAGAGVKEVTFTSSVAANVRRMRSVNPRASATRSGAV